MLRFIIAFMLVGAATPCLSQSPEHQMDAGPAAVLEGLKDARPSLSLPVRIVQQPSTETEADRKRQSEQDARDRENLDVQKELAALTNKTFNLSFWQLILSIVGAVGLLLTLVLTRRSVHAAEEATATTREMMRRQLRAYVLVEQVTVISADNNTKYGIRVLFRNGGQTPAIALKVIASLQTINIGDNQIPRLPQDQSRPFSILSGGEREKILGWIPADHAAELDAGICQIDVFGIATYEDTFGGQHSCHFRYEGGGIHGFKLNSELAAHPVGNHEIEKL